MARRLRKKKRPSRAKGAFRTVYRTLVVLSVLIIALYSAYRALVRPPEQAPPQTAPRPPAQLPLDNPDTPEDESLDTPAPLARKDGYYTFLLAASDQASGNADTIMVVSYDTANQAVGVVSIPRDTLIDRENPKINHTYASGGVEELRDAVAELTGIPIDYHITVDIKAFKAIVNAVDGVDFYVPIDMNYDDPVQDLHIHYKEGMTHLNGQQALEVVGFLKNNDGSGYPDSDIGRTRTQQQLLAAIAKKVLSWTSVSRFNQFIDIFSEHVKTDLSASDIVYFATSALAMDPSTGLQAETLPGDGTVKYRGHSWCYQLDATACLEIFNRLLNPFTTELTMDMVSILQVA